MSVQRKHLVELKAPRKTTPIKRPPTKVSATTKMHQLEARRVAAVATSGRQLPIKAAAVRELPNLVILPATSSHD